MARFYNEIPEEKHMISRATFYLWMFVASQDLFEDALEFLEENLSRPLPFDTCLKASARNIADDYICPDH